MLLWLTGLLLLLRLFCPALIAPVREMLGTDTLQEAVMTLGHVLTENGDA